MASSMVVLPTSPPPRIRFTPAAGCHETFRSRGNGQSSAGELSVSPWLVRRTLRQLPPESSWLTYVFGTIPRRDGGHQRRGALFAKGLKLEICSLKQDYSSSIPIA